MCTGAYVCTYLGAEQVRSDDNDADGHHEVRVGGGVSLVDDVPERPDALLDVDADEHVDETDENVDEEDDRQERAAVLTSLGRQVHRQPRHRRCQPCRMSHQLQQPLTATLN